ncbi:MAG: serpin family protein [Planctomycetota bacterium]
MRPALLRTLPLFALTAAASGQMDLTKALVPRELNPPVAQPELARLTAGNRALALDLYGRLREQPGNLFVSPHSLSIALAMTYAGAAGETAEQMGKVLHFAELGEHVHPAFNALDQRLTPPPQGPPKEPEPRDRPPRKRATRGEPPDRGDAPEPAPLRLHVVNQLWGQQGVPFRPEFLTLLARHYGAGMRLLDFGQAAAAAAAINDWIAKETEQRIKDLVSAEALGRDTALVLTNAIYFKGSWERQFEQAKTEPGPFTLLDGKQISVPMMRQTETFRFMRSGNLAAIELPYAGGDFAMVLLVPDRGAFADFERSLNASRLDDIAKRLSATQVRLTMPRFTCRAKFSLADALGALGMPAAFDRQHANFSGMSEKPLFIDAVLHEAFVLVDETGTEAAAATAVQMGLTSIVPREPEQLAIDRPFIFLIRHVQTGAVLFLGRVVDPR